MRHLLRVCAFVFVLAAIVASPAVAQAATVGITQTPDTTGMGYEAGSSISVGWDCDTAIPVGSSVTLMLAHAGTNGLESVPVQTSLGLSGSTEVQIPSSGGPYFYWIEAAWYADGSWNYVKSEAWWAWYNAYFSSSGTPWWFTVGNAPVITLQPEAQDVSLGSAATFDAAADGVPTPDVQWQVDDGTGWADISGATSPSYTTPDVTDAMDGWRYRAVFTNTIGQTTSDEVGLSVRRAITQLPNTTGQLYPAGSTLHISWVCDGIPAGADIELHIQLEPGSALRLAQGLPSVGSTDVTLPSSGGPYFYYLRASWTPGPGTGLVYSDAYYAGWWFNLSYKPWVSVHPRSQTVAVGSTATFEATASGPPAPSMHWEVDEGSGWTDISGATDTTYTTPAATAAMNGWQYRAVFHNALGDTNSAAAALTVLSVQDVTIGAPTVAFGAKKARRQGSFVATVSPTAAATAVTFTLDLWHLEWQRVNGVRTRVWVPQSSITLSSVSGAAAGTIGATANLAAGQWKMSVSSSASTFYNAGQSAVTEFTVK